MTDQAKHLASKFIIPSDPKTRQSIKNAVKEIDNAMTQIDSQNDHIKKILENVKEKTEVPTTVIKKMATTFHKQNIDQIITDTSDFEAIYDIIMIPKDTQAD